MKAVLKLRQPQASTNRAFNLLRTDTRPVPMPSTDRDKQQNRPQKDHPATRVLGDYTLTKTLGAAR